MMMSNLADPLSQADNACHTNVSVVESWQPVKDEIQEKAQINLLQVKCVLSSLALTSVKVGNFIVVMRSEFDLSLLGEPHIALMLLLDLKSGKYLSRVWNQTVATGSAVDEGKLTDACKNLFFKGRPCLGHPVGDKPFPRKMASKCKIVLGNDAGMNETTCQECSKIMTFPTEPDGVVKEEFDSAESDSINADDFEAKVEQKQQELEYEDMEQHPERSASTIEPEEHKSKHYGAVSDRMCLDCGKIFKSKRSLFEHRKEKHSGVTEVHSCPECGKTFGRKSNLKAHRESLHYGIKFPCQLCDQIFTNRSSMNQHIKKKHHIKTHQEIKQKAQINLLQVKGVEYEDKEPHPELSASTIEPREPSVKNEMDCTQKCIFCNKTFSAYSGFLSYGFQRHLKRVHF